MAITGIFEADFTKFQSAVSDANVSLKGFQDNGDKVQASINRIGDSFSGVKIVQQASLITEAITQIGGASTLTASEQAKVNSILDEAIAKYEALGQKAPADMLALADATKATGQESEIATTALDAMLEPLLAIASVGAALNFASSIVESTSSLEDLSKATGISTEGLQQLAFVGQEFGLGTDVMARGVEQLSAKLANGDKNATDAVRGLGLSVKDLLAEGPEAAFLDVADAAGRVEDPMTKAGLAAELFGGKLSKQLIPLLGDLREKMNEVPKDAIIGQDTINSAHDFEVGLEHLETRLKSVTADALEGIRIGWLKLGDVLTNQTTLLPEDQALWDALSASFNKHADATKPVITNAQVLSDKIKSLQNDAVAPLDATQKQNILTLKSYGESLTDIAKDVGSNEIAVKLFVDAHTAAEEQVKKNAEAMAKLSVEVDKLSDRMKVQTGVTQQLWDELTGLSKGAQAAYDVIIGEKAQQQAKDLADAFTYLNQQAMPPTTVELARVAEAAAKLFNEGQTLSPELLDLAANFGDLGVQAANGWPKVDDLGTSIGKLTVDKVKPLQDSLKELSTAFGELGAAVKLLDPVIGDAIQSFGKMATAIDNAEKSFTNAGKAFSSGDILSGITSSISGIAGIASAAITAGSAVESLWNHFFGSAGRDAVVSFANTFQGGFTGLHQQLDQLGTDGETLWKNLTQGVGKNDPTAAKAAIDAVTTALNNLHTAQNTQITDLANKIGALGGSIPAALDPYIQKLQQAGQLTAANASALQALEGDGKPTYDDLVALQQKYNLTASQMGASFNAAQIDANFQTLIDDTDELTRGGVDLNAALFTVGADGTEALSDLGKAAEGDIEAAEKAGVQIPANLQPIAQSLIDQGLLLDANGNKITDINQLSFGETMQTSLDNLNKTLQDLIATMTGNDPNSFLSSLNTIGNTVVHPKIQPTYDDSQLPPGFQTNNATTTDTSTTPAPSGSTTYQPPAASTAPTSVTAHLNINNAVHIGSSNLVIGTVQSVHQVGAGG